MKKLILLLIIINLFSCQEKFEANKFNGDWIHIDKDGSFSSLPTIKFKNDSIYFIDLYGYTTRAKYKIDKNKISYFFKNDTTTNKFKFSSKDSTIVIGKNKYNFWENYSDFNDLTNYDLIGINKFGKITTDSLRRFDNGFHLLKTKQDFLLFKLNDKYTTDKNHISLFIINNSPIHFDIPTSVIYIGNKINLKDLIVCYIEMWHMNRHKVLLITDYCFANNQYSGFFDSIEFWDDQFKNKIPQLPTLDFYNRKKYLKNYLPEILTVNSLVDFKLLENINSDKNYLISINSEMKLETYLRLKEKITEIKRKKKVKIRTEFKYLPN